MRPNHQLAFSISSLATIAKQTITLVQALQTTMATQAVTYVKRVDNTFSHSTQRIIENNHILQQAIICAQKADIFSRTTWEKLQYNKSLQQAIVYTYQAHALCLMVWNSIKNDKHLQEIIILFYSKGRLLSSEVLQEITKSQSLRQVIYRIHTEVSQEITDNQRLQNEAFLTRWDEVYSNKQLLAAIKCIDRIRGLLFYEVWDSIRDDSALQIVLYRLSASNDNRFRGSDFTAIRTKESLRTALCRVNQHLTCQNFSVILRDETLQRAINNHATQHNRDLSPADWQMITNNYNRLTAVSNRIIAFERYINDNEQALQHTDTTGRQKLSAAKAFIHTANECKQRYLLGHDNAFVALKNHANIATLKQHRSPTWQRAALLAASIVAAVSLLPVTLPYAFYQMWKYRGSFFFYQHTPQSANQALDICDAAPGGDDNSQAVATAAV